MGDEYGEFPRVCEQLVIFKNKILMQLLQAWVMGNQTEVLQLIDRPGVEGYLTYGGSVVGNETHSPDVVEFFTLDDWEDGSLDDWEDGSRRKPSV